MRVDDCSDARRFRRLDMAARSETCAERCKSSSFIDKTTQMRMDECTNTHRFHRLSLASPRRTDQATWRQGDSYRLQTCYGFVPEEPAASFVRRRSSANAEALDQILHLAAQERQRWSDK